MTLTAGLRAHLRPASAQWLATLYVALVSLGISVFLARRMGPEAFGSYFYILGIVTLLAPLQNAGFSTLLLREKISTTPALATLASALPGLALGHLLAISLTMLLGAVLLLPFPQAAKLACGIFCFGMITLSLQLSARLKSAGDFYADARWQVYGRTFSALSILAVTVLTDPSPSVVLVSWGSGLLLAFLLLPFGGRPLRPNFNLDISLYQASLGFLCIELATNLYHRIDIVILHHFLGDSPAVGHYAVAYRLFDGLMLLIAPIASICLRQLRLIWLDTEALQQLSSKLLIAALAIGTLLAGGGYFVAPIALRLLFGATYAEVSAEPAGWLFLSFAFVVPNAILTQLAIATNRERCYAWAACFIAVLNVSLNFALIPGHGILGAAWATIMTEAGLGLALCIGMIRRKSFSGPLA